MLVKMNFHEIEKNYSEIPFSDIDTPGTKLPTIQGQDDRNSTTIQSDIAGMDIMNELNQMPFSEFEKARLIKKQMMGRNGQANQMRSYNNTTLENYDQRRILDGSGKYNSINEIQLPSNNYTPMQQSESEVFDN